MAIILTNCTFCFWGGNIWTQHLCPYVHHSFNALLQYTLVWSFSTNMKHRSLLNFGGKGHYSIHTFACCVQLDTPTGQLSVAHWEISDLVFVCVYVVRDVVYTVYIVFYVDQIQRPESTSSDNVRQLVASLYQTINSEQYYNTQQRLLLARQEQLRLQLEPLEKVCFIMFCIRSFMYIIAS